MSTANTIAESGLVRIYRDLTAGDIDAEKAMLEIRGSTLAPTMLDGHLNSVRVSDCGPGVVDRLVVRGDGVNTVLADSGVLGTTTNILGMVITGGGTGSPVARYATAGSIIDGFGGTLTKHAVYYLGVGGAISLTPGVVEVAVGIAIDSDKFLFAPCCCEKVGLLSLNYCFASALFACADGATYCVEGPGSPECIPALCFDPSVTQNWYCGFETPNDMDPGQDSFLNLIFYASAAPANPTQLALNIRSVPLGASIFAGGSVFTPALVNPVPPGTSTLFSSITTIPGGTLTAAQMNRLTFTRQGAAAGDTFAGNIYMINAQLKYLVRCSN
jgi:hypothetical protein